MAALCRTRRIRNERWYSAWDVLALGMLSPMVVQELGASRDSGGQRRWAKWISVVWRYPLGLKRFHAFPAIGLSAIVIPVIALGTSFTLFLTLLLVATLVLTAYLATYKTPLLLVASRARCRPMLVIEAAPELTNDLCELISKIIASRRKAWMSYSLRWGFISHADFYDAPSMTLSSLPTLIMASGWLNERIGLVPFWNGWISALAAIFAIGGVLYRPTQLYRRLTRRVLQSLCPDCNYPLAGIPNAIDPALLNGTHTGPARCPECGTHWPLVPPPVPSN